MIKLLCGADKEELEGKIEEVRNRTVTEIDQTVFDWAKKELFDKADLPLDTQSFVEVDGVEYYRYHAGATYGFTWINPNPKQGAVTITARGVAQYGGTNSARLKTIYDDGTYGPDLHIVVSGESRTVTATTDASKTLTKITGNYDMENWVLLDMSVMSVQAEYNIGLPLANENAAGGVLADPATETDTIPARIGKDGRLYVPGATDEQITNAVNAYLADNPVSGGSAKFRLLRSVTIPEDVTTDTSDIEWVVNDDNAVTSFNVSTDSDGNTFATREILIIGNFGVGSNNYYGVADQNGRTGYANLFCNRDAFGTSLGKKVIHIQCVATIAFSTMYGNDNYSGNDNALHVYRKDEDVTKLKIGGFNNSGGWLVGSTFDIYVK